MATNTANRILDELAEPSRRAILERLRTGAKSVNTLVAETGLNQPNVSNHLARMRERGIVTALRRGRYVFYSLADPLVETLLGTLTPEIGPAEGAACTPDASANKVARLVNALSEGDEHEAATIVRECLESGCSMVDLYTDVLQPSIEVIGERSWNARLSMVEVHVATGIVERVMVDIARHYPIAPPNGRSAVLGAAEGNWHTLGLRMIADVLAHEGWQVYYLGASVPAAAFLRVVRERQTDCVLISCAMSADEAVAASLVERLNGLREGESLQRLQIWIGGPLARELPGLAQRVGADFTAWDVREVSERL